MHKVEPERQPELLADEVSWRSGPAGSEVVLAGARFDEADEVPDRLHRQRRMNREHRGCSDRDRDWVEIFVGIVGDLVIQGRVDDEVGRNNEYGIAVRCCPCPLTHADIAASTAYVLDVKLFPEMLGQALRNQAAEYIRRTTRRVWNDHTHGSCRIGLRESDARCGRQRGSTGGHMQKISAGKFHFEPPLRPFPSIGYRVYVFAPTGRRTVNTEPVPGSLFTVTSPPIMRASLRVMASPSPVPPKRCAVAASAWLNSSNSFACCSGVMPMPVSATASSIQSRPLATLRARSLTSPSLVNLQALLNRLSRICRRRMGSTVNAPRFSWASTTRRFLFCSASCPAVPMTSLISGANSTVCELSSSFPASIFDKSSTWLMRPRR